MKSQAVPYRVDARWALYVLFGSIGLIVVLIGIYANQADHGWAVFAGGSLAAFGAFAVGALLGLLFGVPHSAEKSTTSSTTWALIPNTSLDQISDWLTKILVGVGLTQLFEIPSKFQALASYLAPVFGGTDASKGFSLAVVISSSIVGFLASWVWTRLLLSADLARRRSTSTADRATSTGRAQEGSQLNGQPCKADGGWRPQGCGRSRHRFTRARPDHR